MTLNRRSQEWKINGNTSELSLALGTECINILINVIISPLPENANFRLKYFILSKVFSDEGDIKKFTTVCLPVEEIILSRSSWIFSSYRQTNRGIKKILDIIDRKKSGVNSKEL